MCTAVHTGVESTETHDVGYGLRQLTDVAVKALSPGINDPTTAVHALDPTETARHRKLAQIVRYALSGGWPTNGGG